MKQNKIIQEYTEKTIFTRSLICALSNTEKGNFSRILNDITEVRPSTANRFFDDIETSLKKELELINKLRNK